MGWTLGGSAVWQWHRLGMECNNFELSWNLRVCGVRLAVQHCGKGGSATEANQTLTASGGHDACTSRPLNLPVVSRVAYPAESWAVLPDV